MHNACCLRIQPRGSIRDGALIFRPVDKGGHYTKGGSNREWGSNRASTVNEDDKTYSLVSALHPLAEVEDRTVQMLVRIKAIHAVLFNKTVFWILT